MAWGVVSAAHIPEQERIYAEGRRLRPEPYAGRHRIHAAKLHPERRLLAGLARAPIRRG